MGVLNETVTTNKCVVKDVVSSYLLYWVRVTSHRVAFRARARDKTSHTDESTLDDTTFDEFVNTQYSTLLTISNAILSRHWSLQMKPAHPAPLPESCSLFHRAGRDIVYLLSTGSQPIARALPSCLS